MKVKDLFKNLQIVSNNKWLETSAFELPDETLVIMMNARKAGKRFRNAKSS